MLNSPYNDKTKCKQKGLIVEAKVCMYQKFEVQVSYSLLKIMLHAKDTYEQKVKLLTLARQIEGLTETLVGRH